MAKKVSLDRLMGGGLLEMFRSELGRVAANINDRNTSATAKRKITITLEIKPDDEREIGHYEASVKSTLQPRKSLEGKFRFGLSATGEGVAAEFNADMVGQMNLDGEEAGRESEEQTQGSNILDLRDRKERKAV